MASLADAPKLVGFFSYSREDDNDSRGRLSQLREQIRAELRSQLGRKGKDFKLWQDKFAIAYGTVWQDDLNSAILESVFLILIIIPCAIRSNNYKIEFDAFQARQERLGRTNLIFPILYITVPELNDDSWRQHPVLKIVRNRQYPDWR